MNLSILCCVIITFLSNLVERVFTLLFVPENTLSLQELKDYAVDQGRYNYKLHAL